MLHSDMNFCAKTSEDFDISNAMLHHHNFYMNIFRMLQFRSTYIRVTHSTVGQIVTSIFQKLNK